MEESIVADASKIKKTISDNLVNIIIAAIFLIMVIAVVAIIKYNTPDTSLPASERTSGLYEITETDLFATKNFTSDQVSVLGIMLGDTQAHVLDTLGSPDNRADYPAESIINLEYSSKIGLNETGLIVHIRNGNVARISMLPPFNARLVGETKIGYNKTDLYNLLGAPDDLQFVPVSSGSPIVYRLLKYNNQRIEVTMRKNEQTGLNLVP